MKRLAGLLCMVLIAAVVQAVAAGLISKQQAEQNALNAVGNGQVTQAYLDKQKGKLVWNVDLKGGGNDYEVWVDAHSGGIMTVITEPSVSPAQISKQQAEQIALNAVGGGTVLSAHRDHWKGYKIWDIDISQPGVEYTVYVDRNTGAVLKIKSKVGQANLKYISKAQAEKIALDAVGGGKVLLARLEKNDHPPVWSVDVKATKGGEFEVKVNAYNGKVVAIIPGA